VTKPSTTVDPQELVPPPRAERKIWIVVRPNGEHFFLEKEPLDGLEAWALGQDVTILEYGFVRVAFRPGKRS